MRYGILVLIVLALVVPAVTLAQASEFQVRVFAGDDTTSPTTPVLLGATSTAATQIDLEWSVATDTVGLGGYVLLRDSVPIATTTLTSYIDTGLTPATFYTYAVYAFDLFGNISTTSNALSTTTQAVPITPPAETTAGGVETSTLTFRLLSFALETAPNSASFRWTTSKPARYTLRWGRSDLYDDGFILNEVYRTSQETSITELEPGTVYLYELVGYDNDGRRLELRTGQFKTKTREYLTPVNIAQFDAVVDALDVSLSWVMPPVVPGTMVRIVRSYLGYPTDPYDGAVVYEGIGDTYQDSGAFAVASPLYYTAFLSFPDGSFSSGAVVRVTYRDAASIPNEAEGVPPEEEELPELIPDFGLVANQIQILQGEVTTTFANSEIMLLATEPFMLSIPYTAVPNHLKSIVVTLADPASANRAYSFLLRINKERTAYEATLAPVGVSGAARVMVEIFDYERKLVGRYRTKIVFIQSSSTIQSAVIFPDQFVRIGYTALPYFGVGVVLVGGVVFWFLRRRRAEDKR